MKFFIFFGFKLCKLFTGGFELICILLYTFEESVNVLYSCTIMGVSCFVEDLIVVVANGT